MVAISMDVKHNLIDSHADDRHPLPKKDFSQVSEAVKHRILNFCVKDIHLACYLVDPRFAGKGLSDDQFLAA